MNGTIFEREEPWRTRSQAFTTGRGTSTITSVQIDIRHTAGTNYDPKVSIFTDASGSPGTSLATLTDPGTNTDGLNTFTLASPLSLSKNTTYHVVIESTSSRFGVRTTLTGGEDSDGTARWSIADSHDERFSDTGRWSSDSEELRIRIDGTYVDDLTDATLSALSIENAANDTGINFDETFASGTTSYTALVANAVAQITVKPTTNDSAASVAYLDASNSAIADADTDKAGHQVSLSDGANTVKVKVTAEDGTSTRTYTITVTRAAAHLSTDKTLSALSIAIAEDDSAISFDQTFASDVQSYTASVAFSVRRITVSATTNHSGASIAYLNASNNALADADNDKAGHQVDLRIGSNDIKVRVTAEDDVSTKTYVITVSRATTNTGPATGRPTIRGVCTRVPTGCLPAPMQVGRKVEAFLGSIGDSDGVGGGFSYQWIRVNDGIETEIGGATSNTYTLAEADNGKKIKVRFGFTDGKGNAEARTSEATREVVRRQHSCNSRRNADWCTRLWTLTQELSAGPEGKFYGYRAIGRYGKGQLLDDSIEYRDANNRRTTVSVGEIGIYDYDGIRDEVVVGLKGKWLPDASVFNIGGTKFEANEGKTDVLGLYAWPRPRGLRWLNGQFVTVSVRIRHTAYLSVSDIEASEDNDPSLDFVVNLTSGASGAVTVNYATSGGTATAGVDYEATSGQLTFARGERTKTISVPIIDDNIEDSGETVILTLSGATGAEIRDGTAVATILNTEATTVPGLTASFAGVPNAHGGRNDPLTFRIKFSAGLAEGSKPALRQALSVTGGSQSIVRKLTGTKLWQVKIKPSGHEAVTLALAPTTDCGADSALCTADGRMLSAPVSATVQGPPGLSVADAEVNEGAADAALAFAVTLSRAASGTVTVEYETEDGTATAPADYAETSGALTFDAGETTKTVSVPVHADSENEGSETMKLKLSDPDGAYLADAEATGTITNDGPIPQAWMARFGRTVADRVLDAVDGWLRAARAPGVEATAAGQALSFDTAAVDAEALAARDEEAPTQALTAWLRGEDGEEERAALSDARTVTARELLTGTSFALTGGSAAGGTVSAWGRGAVSRFDGREDELTLDGQVGNLMLGADFTHGRATAGLMLSHARGSGGYRGESAGRIGAILTGLYPYGRYAVNDRLSVWGVAGYGKSTLRVEPEAQAALETDMDLVMGSVGMRGILMKAPPEGGAELAVKSDAMVVRTTSEAVSGSAGNLAAAEADVTRLRLGLEGTRAFRFAGGASLVPSVELGMRHDGGDAETGFGADIGAGLAWKDPAMGLSADVRARGLLTHEDGSFREWGFAGALAWDPTPNSARGPSLSLSQAVGAQASGGVEALLGPQTAKALEAANDHDGTELERRTLEPKAGYGFALHDDRFTGTPEVGLGLTESGHELVIAWRLAEEKSAGLAFGLDVEGARQENAGGTAGHRLGLGFGWRLEDAGAGGFEVRFEGSRLQPANDAAEHRVGVTLHASW